MDLKKQDLKQSRSVKSKTTQEQSYESTGQTHQSTEISSNSQQSNSEQMEFFQMSYAVAILANPFQLQGSNLQKKTKDTSGQKCLDLYEASGQDGSFAKMLVDTLNLVSTKLPHHWKMKDTPSGRLLFQRAVSMPHTKETGSTLWPTPTAMTGGTGVAPSHKTGKHGWNIGAAVSDSLSENPVRMWPTPTASDYKGAPKNRYLGSETYKSNLREAARTSETDGQLNPTWVEWLMGFPIGHTELKHWETRSSRKSQKSSDKQ